MEHGTSNPKTLDCRPLVRHHHNLINIPSVQTQHQIIRNPLPRILPRDRIANSRRLPPPPRNLNTNPDRLTRLAIDPPASVDDGESLSALHQSVLHDPLVLVRYLQQDMIQRHHGIRKVATEARHAGRAADDNMRLSRGAGAAQLSERLEQSGHAFAADFLVVDGDFGGDEFAADGGDDFVDEMAALGSGDDEAFGDGGEVVRVSLDDFEVGRPFGREDGGQFGWDAAEGDAPVACGEGVFEGGEADAGAGAEKCDGLGVSGHFGGLVDDALLWRCGYGIAW